MEVPVRLPKAALSQYLRTRCDRMLACSINERNAASDTLLALPARPGLAGFKARGIEFEGEFLRELSALFPDNYVDVKRQQQPGTDRDIAFKKALEAILVFELALPQLFHEPGLPEGRYRSVLLPALELDPATFPDMTELRPDLVVALDRATAPAELTSHEVRPNGMVRAVDARDQRIPLRVVDLKFAEQLNTAYAGEVCLYSMVLASWLEHPDVELSKLFYVTANPGILVRHTDRTNTMPAVAAPVAERMAWLESQVENAEADLYAPPVVRFMREDLPRVIARMGNWRDLEWHVTPSCAFCDYLGYPGWSKRGIIQVQSEATKKRPGQRPPQLDDYCYEDAKKNHRVNQLPNVTRGMLRTLVSQKIALLPDLRTQAGTEAVFDAHNGLKIESRRLPRKAGAVVDGAAVLHPGAVAGQLASYANMLVTIVCFFDAATGLLTSLAMSVDYRSPSDLVRGPVKDGKETWVPDRPVLDRKQQNMWVMEDATSKCEGEHLLDCLRFLSQFIEYVFRPDAAPAEVADKEEWARYARAKATIQVVFWDRRQDNAFREAIGRNLHLITHARDVAHALIWLFPPEEVVPSDNLATAPAVAYLHESTTRLTALPTVVNDDILSVAFHLANFSDNVSPFLWDRIAGVIPKERSLEITQRIPPKNPPMAISQCIDQYRVTLRTLLHALRAIIFHLQREHRKQLKGAAPLIENMQPTLFNRVAADSMLWLTHARVSEGMEQLDLRVSFTTDAHELEAKYQALRVEGQVVGGERDQILKEWLGAGVNQVPAQPAANHLLFRVRPSSRNVKFRNEAGFMVLLPEEPVGVGLMTVAGLARALGAAVPTAATHPGWRNGDEFKPLTTFVEARLRYFDRERLVALIEMDAWGQKFAKFSALAASGIVDLAGSLILMEGKSLSSFAELKAVAVSIANPSIAVAAPETQTALVEIRRTPGKDQIKPAARVLWNADALCEAPTDTSMDEFETLLDTLLKLEWPAGKEIQINDSQKAAISQVISNQLMLVWGGPGTGKTQTLSAAVVLEILLRVKSKHPRQRIYVTGPTYRSVGEVAERMLRFLNFLPATVKDYLKDRLTVTFVASQGNEKAWDDLLDADAKYAGFRTESFVGDDQYINGSTAIGNLGDLRTRLLSDEPRIELVFAVTKRSYWIGKGGRRNKANDEFEAVAGLFDRIYIDESSQVSVADSLPTLGLLSEGGRLALFGDPLQMPPIQHLAPPKGAEHLVGSLHTYLRRRFPKVADRECFLKYNYRSCEPIVSYARMIGYKREFESMAPDRCLPFTALGAAPAGWNTNITWSPLYAEVLDSARPCVSVTYEDGIAGQANDFEAMLVAGTVLSLRTAEQTRLGAGFSEDTFWSKTIGVVTPHRAQRSAIVELLRASAPPAASATDLIDEAVDTVERFQGGEREVILVSFGVGDPDLVSSEEAFLFQRERINVAVSRARSKAVVFVSRDLLYHLPDDKEVISASRAIKWFAYQLADQRIPALPVLHKGVGRPVDVSFATYAKRT